VCVGKHSLHKQEISAVSMSSISPRLVLSADKSGSMVRWDQHNDNRNVLHFGVGSVICVACSPHNEDEAAIGCQSGAVLVVDIVNVEILIRSDR
jgi:gem associated protein 5